MYMYIIFIVAILDIVFVSIIMLVLLSILSMSKLQRDLEEQRELVAKLRAKLCTNNSEVAHLTQANLQAQEDIQHLRAVSLHSCYLMPAACTFML